MRATLWTLIFLYIPNFCIAQDPEDSYNKGWQYLYSQRDSSYFHFQKAITGYKELGDIDSELLAYHGLLYANGYFYDLQSYKTNLKNYEDRVYGDAGKCSEYVNYFRDRLYLEKINYHFKLSEYEPAQVYIDSLSRFLNLRKYEDRDKDYYTNYINSGLYQGSIYKNQNKVTLALDKYKQLEGYINRYKDSLYDYKNSIFSIKRLEAKAYASLGDIDRAILSQLVALDVIDNDVSYTNSKLDIQTDLISNLITAQEFDDAKTLVKILDAEKIEKATFRIRLLDQKIRISKIEGDRIKNKKYHLKKLEELNDYLQISLHPDIINTYIKFSADELHWRDYKSALEKLTKASLLLPPLDQKQNLQLTKLHLDLAAQYLEVYLSLRENQVHAEEIMIHSQNLLKALDILQPQFESKLDKQYLIDTTYPALQTSFVLMYDLFTSTEDRKYLEQAFAITEKSKAIELRSIRQAGIAQRSLNIDPEIIEKENLFLYTINSLEKEQFTSNEMDQNTQDRLLKEKEAYGVFVNELRDSYPSYYNLRYKNDVTSLDRAINYLEENQSVISFFQVRDTMYILRLEREDPSIFKIPFSEEIKDKVKDFYATISRINVKEIQKSDVLSQELYEQLIAPIFPDTLPQSLTIIPDGLLYYIPFEVLKKEEDFLLSTTTVSYKPSVSFEEGSSMHQPKEAQFVGFAPSFQSSNTLQLSALNFNEEEIERANSYYDGTTYKGEEGSLSRFRESVKTFSTQQKKAIYHFATHAITNDTLPEYSYLAFAPRENTEDFILYAKDLYTEQLDAAMVVLSACETGLGTLTNGQGMQSLAQGFMYGGASSLVYSKWSVSDKQTAEMMALFYKFLDEGLPKDVALQKAKIAYLDTAEDPILKHPFYWASFVFSGDAVPLISSPALPSWLWIVGALLTIVLIILFIRRR